MGTDWERMSGQGGAYLVERAAAVLQNGRLTPLALGLVEAEAQRLKFILDEEIPRLEPAGDLTPAAIAALRTYYQARRDAAENVVAAARRMMAQPTPTPALPHRGREQELGGRPEQTVPAQATPHPVPPPQGGRENRRNERSLREFFADRSILILSYVGAFLLIVATLLFELSAFSAVDSTARFAGVLVLNIVFGVAGWFCFRLPAMRLVGRTYIAIAALMVPLTFIAAWVFLVLQQYGLSRDLAIAIAAASCALLYGALAVNLQSKGYALLSLVAFAVAWGATLDLVDPGRWRGALLTVVAGAYLVIAHRSARFSRFHAAFSRLADWAIHLAALGAVVVTAISAVNLPAREGWQIATVTAALVAILYVAYGLQVKSPAGGAVAMLFLAVAWISAVNVIDLEPLTGLLLTPLVAIYILATYRSRRIPGVDVVFATWGEPFIHQATLLALGWTAYSASTVFTGSSDQAWLLAAATLAVVALLYAWYATLSAQRYGGLAAMVALGLAWFCLLNGTDIWPWRGLAFTPVMAFYILVASRRPVIRNLFASEPELMITGAAGVAAGWSIYATATMADPTGSAWYPTTAALTMIALLYALDARLRGDRLAPALSLGALLGAWIADTMVLQLGVWRGLALTPLAFLFSLLAFRGDRFGSLGAAFARVADPFVHAVALIAIAWSAYPALAEIGQGQAVSPAAYAYLAWTFGALTAAYALYSWLSKRQWMQWTVAIGVTLTTITANQALGLDLSALAVEFLALAVGKAIVARFYRGTRMHTFLYVTAATQAVIAAAIPVEQDWLHAVILITAGAMGTFMAVDSKRPEWLYLGGAFFTYGWYWLLKVVIPPPPNPGPSTLELIFSPLPVIYAAVAVVVHRFGTNITWRVPVYAWAGTVALGVVYLGVQQDERTILGVALLAYAAAIYVASAFEDEPYGVPGASLTGAIGLFSLLTAGSAAAQWYPLTFTLVAWAIYAAGFAWRGTDRQMWRAMHRFSGLALMALTAMACFAGTDFSATGNPAAFAALAATWALALMFALDARVSAAPAFDYAALITASLGSYWIARYFGADNVQWYVAAPGLALVAGGIMLHADRRFKTPVASIANSWIGIGSAGLLGTTAFQTLDSTPSASLYTGLLLCEAVAALLVGIATRSRALVLAGAAGAALASLRAIVILIQAVPLFIVFGLVAIVLLGGAAALAVLRARFADARVAMTRSWNDWT